MQSVGFVPGEEREGFEVRELRQDRRQARENVLRVAPTHRRFRTVTAMRGEGRHVHR
jgi:hypothetical protein